MARVVRTNLDSFWGNEAQALKPKLAQSIAYSFQTVLQSQITSPWPILRTRATQKVPLVFMKEPCVRDRST